MELFRVLSRDEHLKRNAGVLEAFADHGKRLKSGTKRGAAAVTDVVKPKTKPGSQVIRTPYMQPHTTERRKQYLVRAFYPIKNLQLFMLEVTPGGMAVEGLASSEWHKLAISDHHQKGISLHHLSIVRMA